MKAAVFQTVAVVEFTRKMARSRDDDSRTLGTQREKGRESEARRWRTLCVIAVSLFVAALLSATFLVLKDGQLTPSAIASANAPGRTTVYRSRHIKQSSVILIL